MLKDGRSKETDIIRPYATLTNVLKFFNTTKEWGAEEGYEGEYEQEL